MGGRKQEQGIKEDQSLRGLFRERACTKKWGIRSFKSRTKGGEGGKGKGGTFYEKQGGQKS